MKILLPRAKKGPGYKKRNYDFEMLAEQAERHVPVEKYCGPKKNVKLQPRQKAGKKVVLMD
jgi:hypothetical protein